MKVLLAKSAGFCYGVERAVKLLEINGLEPATPDEAREIYGLTRKVF